MRIGDMWREDKLTLLNTIGNVNGRSTIEGKTTTHKAEEHNTSAPDVQFRPGVLNTFEDLGGGVVR